MFQARWAYDGSAQGGKKVAFGNTWVIAAIVVRLPFCPSPVAPRCSPPARHAEIRQSPPFSRCASRTPRAGIRRSRTAGRIPAIPACRPPQDASCTSHAT